MRVDMFDDWGEAVYFQDAVDFLKRHETKEEKAMSEVKIVEMKTDEFGITRKKDGEDEFKYCLHEDCCTWEYNNLKPYKRYVCAMIPIPDGYRLATDEDMKSNKPDGYKYMENISIGWQNGYKYNRGKWHDCRTYIVPIKSERDKKKEAIEDKLAEARAIVRKAEEELKNI